MSHEQPSSPEQKPLEPAVREAYLREWAWHIEFILASYEREEAYPKPIAATLKERFSIMTDLMSYCARTKRLPAFVKSETQFEQDVASLARIYGWMKDLILYNQIAHEALEELAPEEAIYDLGQRDRLAKRDHYPYVGPIINGIAAAWGKDAAANRGYFSKLIRSDGSLVSKEWFFTFSRYEGGIAASIEVSSRRFRVFKNDQPVREDIWFKTIGGLSEGFMVADIEYKTEAHQGHGTNYLRPDGTFLLSESRAFELKSGYAFHEGRAWVDLKSGGQQLLDEQGKELLSAPATYRDVAPFKNGMALVERLGQIPHHVYVDRQGKVICDPNGEAIAAVSSKRSTDLPILPVIKSNTCFLYDVVEKKTIWTGDVEKVRDIHPFIGGVALIEWKTPLTGWSCVKRDGTFLETSEGRKVFQNVKLGEAGILSVKMDNKWFLFNVVDEQIYPDTEGFDEMGEPHAGMVGVRRGRTANFLKKDGSYRWPSFLPFTRLMELGEGMTLASNAGEEYFSILRPDGTALSTTIPLTQEGNDFPRFEGGICYIESEGEVRFLTHAGRTVFSQE